MNHVCGGLVLAVILTLSACGLVAGAADQVCPVAGDQAVTDILKPIWQKYRLPAIAGAIVTSKGLDICGVVGVRKNGTGIGVSVGITD